MKIHRDLAVAVMKRMAGASSSTTTVRGEREVARGERKRERKKKRKKEKKPRNDEIAHGKKSSGLQFNEISDGRY